MAVGLSEPSKLLPIEGVELAVHSAAIRYAERDDLVLISLCDGATCAAVFTQNKFCAAPVAVAKQHIQGAEPRALLINSGNANAGTGQLGMDNALQSCSEAAMGLGLHQQQVLPFSTGVIGEQLPIEKMSAGIQQVTQALSEDNWLSAAKAIMTTDTVAKGTSEEVELDGKTVTITGISKGSGMICPNMATMLAYVATDAAISKDVLIEMLNRANAASFNRITVDGDTSTNDALVLMASAKADAPPIESMDSDFAEMFYAALERILVHLATAIIRDAEGATKFVKISVSGANHDSDAREIAYTIAHSPLVKTALFASDPNWGRILAAAGRSNVQFLDLAQVNLVINDANIITSGQPSESYTEKAGQQAFAESEINIELDLKAGTGQFHVWTSDLSHGYVSINADYRS